MSIKTENWRRFEFSARDGLKLRGRIYGGNCGSTPVLCLPGLTRNSADFHQLATHLSAGTAQRLVYTLDFRGRGMSDWDPDWHRYNPFIETDDVLAVVDGAGLDKVHIIGTSRGGIIIHVLAAVRPSILGSVVLNDIGPVIDGTGLVRIRHYLQSSNPLTGWKSAAEMLKAASSGQFSAWDDDEWLRQARLIFLEKGGKLIGNFDPGVAKTVTNFDLDQPIPELWPQFRGLAKVPLMAIRGDNSDLFSADTLAQMRAQRPDMAVINVPGQGHAPDLGTPGIPEAITKFLDKAK